MIWRPAYTIARAVSGRARCSIPHASTATLLALLIVLVPQIAFASLTFEAPCRAYDTGPTCTDVATGDLNGDGHADVGTANSGSPSVTLYLTNPDGSFGPRTDLSMSSLTNSSIAFGDVNGDGLLDLLATKASGAPGVYYRLNTGGGNFPSVQSLPDAHSPRAVRVTDLNQDGLPDLVVLAAVTGGPSGWGYLDTWLGTGGGSFGPMISLDVSQYVGGTTFLAFTVRLRDLNHDSYPDLFVAQSFAYNLTFLGQGDGHFQPPNMISDWMGGPGDIAELTGDADEDYVEIKYGELRVLAGAGDGTYSLLSSAPVSGIGWAVLLEDFNADGRSDLLTSRSCLPATPGPQFLSALSYAQSDIVRAATGDFTGDGRLDFAATNGVRTLYRYEGNGDGTFGLWRHESTASATSRPALGDFNQDGRPDIVVAVDSGSTLPGSIELRLGRPDGNYDPPISLATAEGARAVSVGDFDRDGHLDVAVAGAAVPISLFRGNGDGTLQPREDFPAAQTAVDLLTVELNGDGFPDLLEVGGSSSTVHLNSAGGFPASGVSLAGTGHPPAFGDVDLDGRIDLVLLDATNKKINYYRSLGSGNFAPALVSLPPGTPAAAGLGDFDGDGHLDLALLNSATPYSSLPFAVSLHQGTPAGDFTQLGLVAVGGEPRDLTVADFDSDGHLDVATTAFTARAVTVLSGDGFGGLPGRDDFGTGGLSTALAVGDLNGDGRPDLLAATSSPNGITLLRQPSSVSAAPPPAALSLMLAPPRPNPTTGAALVPFTLAVPAHVQVGVFDISGRLVARLADDDFMAGAHSLTWDGRTAGGQRAAGGAYFIRLMTATSVVTRSLRVVR